MVSFEVFSQLEIRTGVVLEAVDHPNADKLYVLKVNLGDHSIQLVAGLKAFYSPQELVGKSIVVLSNLEHRIVRGVESQGMLLAAQGKETVSVLIPDREVEAGSIIR